MPQLSTRMPGISNLRLRLGLGARAQEIINAAAQRLYGEKYQGVWEAGVFAVDDVVFHPEKFYECIVARDSNDTDDPATDTTGWKIATSLREDVSGSIGLAGVKGQIFTSSGTWVKPSRTGFVKVLLVGGGGGGGGGGRSSSAGGGGSSGQMIIADVSVDGNIVVTIASGGQGGDGADGVNTSGRSDDGEDGGNSKFGDLLTALGGVKGFGSYYSTLQTFYEGGGGETMRTTYQALFPIGSRQAAAVGVTNLVSTVSMSAGIVQGEESVVLKVHLGGAAAAAAGLF